MKINRMIKQYYFLLRKKKIKPLIILIGGGASVGKSTISLRVASKLGIVNCIGTDAIREILQVGFPKNKILTYPTYLAWKSISNKFSSEILIKGFKQQAKIVCQGVNKVLTRSVEKGEPMIIEGIHLLPSEFVKKVKSYNNIHFFILHLPDLKTYHERLKIRSFTTHTYKSPEDYKNYIICIKEIHDWLVKEAYKYNIPVVNNLSISETVNFIVENVLKKILNNVT